MIAMRTRRILGFFQASPNFLSNGRYAVGVMKPAPFAGPAVGESDQAGDRVYWGSVDA